jgi:hypothetical protein
MQNLFCLHMTQVEVSGCTVLVPLSICTFKYNSCVSFVRCLIVAAKQNNLGILLQWNDSTTDYNRLQQVCWSEVFVIQHANYTVMYKYHICISLTCLGLIKWESFPIVTSICCNFLPENLYSLKSLKCLELWEHSENIHYRVLQIMYKHWLRHFIYFLSMECEMTLIFWFQSMKKIILHLGIYGIWNFVLA